MMIPQGKFEVGTYQLSYIHLLTKFIAFGKFYDPSRNSELHFTYNRDYNYILCFIIYCINPVLNIERRLQMILCCLHQNIYSHFEIVCQSSWKFTTLWVSIRGRHVSSFSQFLTRWIYYLHSANWKDIALLVSRMESITFVIMESITFVRRFLFIEDFIIIPFFHISLSD